MEESYLQSTEQIYIMEAGILNRLSAFRDGEDHTFTYDFTNEEYPQLREQYGIAATAGEGSEFQRAMRLMHEYAPRLTHKSDYDNHVPMTALDLLAYALDNPQQGINCRAKAQILSEMCLSLGIYARKVWIQPLSPFDGDCHVVNEVWDTTLNKWIMLDVTNDQYWVDENGMPLSVLEIREKGASMAFCTPVCPGDSLDDLPALKEEHIDSFLYIMKNMAFTRYCSAFGPTEIRPVYTLLPEGLNIGYEPFISEEAVRRAPV